MIQCLLGLFAVDVDGLESGPFSYLVEFDAGRVVAELHETVFNALLAIVVLHIVAIFFYLAWRRQNLIRSMISGQSIWTGELPVMVTNDSGLGPLCLPVAVWLSTPPWRCSAKSEIVNNARC